MGNRAIVVGSGAGGSTAAMVLAHRGWDVVVSPKAPAASANFQQLNRAVVDLLVRAGILAENAPAGETPT